MRKWWTAFTNAVTRGATREVTRGMKDEKDVSSVGEATTNAEQRTAVQVAITTTRLDERVTEGLRALGDRLLVAVATAQIAVADWNRAHSVDQQLERQQRERAAQTRRATVYGQPIDHGRALISLRQLAVADVFFVVAEIVFWYLVFGRDIEPSDPWYAVSRIGPAFLAVLVPLFGLLAARSAGGSWQRMIRHPASEPAERRFQLAGTAASTLLLVAAVAAVFALVHWRYDEGLVLGALQLPGFWMSWLFAGVVLADFVARAFCTSELAETDRARAREVAGDRARIGALSDRITGDLRAWHTAWNALRFEVDTTMDAVARVVLTGEGMILSSRAHRGDRPAASPAVVEVPAPSRPAEKAEHAGYALPSADQPEHLELQLLRPALRALRSAVDLLAEHVPPALAASGLPHEELAGLAGRVAALELAGSTEEPVEVPAPRQPAEDGADATEGEEGDDGVVPLRLTGSTD